MVLGADVTTKTRLISLNNPFVRRVRRTVSNFPPGMPESFLRRVQNPSDKTPKPSDTPKNSGRSSNPDQHTGHNAKVRES